MKVKLFAFIATLFFGLACTNAQVVQGTGPPGGIGEPRFGAKAGLNISTFVGDDVIDISPKLGAYIGGLAEIPAFFDNFYLQPELLISFQGADIGIGTENLNLAYIHLPIMAKYHITDAFAAEFGPQIGIKIADNGEDIPGNPETNSFQAGINVGGGYRLNESFYFQLRFGAGLSKLQDTSDLRNGVLSIGACYFF